LRYQWPLAGVLLTFLIGVAVAGHGGGVVSGMLSILVFGPAYLFQNRVRRRRGTLPVQPAETPQEKAEADARFLRLTAVSQVIIAVILVAAVAAGRGSWLSGAGWTAWLLLSAAFGISSAPRTLAIGELRATGRSLRWARALSGALELVFGIAAAVVGVTNERSHWVGSSRWTIAFLVAAGVWLLGALSLFRSHRHPR
jgi:hypothetical protein